MQHCIVKENCRVRGVVAPWGHAKPIGLMIPAGKDGEVSQQKDGSIIATFKYPRHTVVAELPADAVSLA